MTVCGTCICPTPLPTPPIGDLCNYINESYAICHVGVTTHGMSFGNAVFTGMVIGVVGLSFLFAIYKLFWDDEYNKAPMRGK